MGYSPHAMDVLSEKLYRSLTIAESFLASEILYP
jgi:hypothetical protein